MNREQKRKAVKNKSQKILNNNIPENALYRALSFHKNGELQKAKVIYEKIIQLEPNNSQVLNYLGVLKAQIGDNKSAISLIKKAVNLEPLNFKYLNNLGNTYRAFEQLDNAIDCYKRAIQADKNSAEYHLNLGIALTEKGIIEEAIASLEKALTINPNYQQVNMALGDIFQTQGKLDKAISSYIKALSIDPKYSKNQNPNNFDALLSLGMALYRRGNLKESQITYEQALEINPHSTECLTNIAATFYEQGRVDIAEACYQAVVDLIPTSTDAHINLGFLLSQQEKYDEAIECYKAALKQDQNSVNAIAGLAEVFGKKSDWKTVFQLYQKILKLDSNSADAYAKLGISLREIGKSKEAIPQFEKAISINNRHIKAYANLGLALQDVGKQSEAKFIFDYSELVAKYQFTSIEGWQNLTAYNHDLKDYIVRHPTLLKNRPGKPINKGSQTYEIFTDNTPVITALRKKINSYLEDYFSRFTSNSNYQFFNNIPLDWKLSGWAVVLESEGFQSSHIHPESYCSGVYYIQVPNTIKENNSEAGHLNFETCFSSKLDMKNSDKYQVKPQAGLLVIFPSYFWHSTIPFIGDSERICISFNMVPVSS